MYELHPDLKSPPDHARIWRFMDIGKFLWLLSSSALYFCRLDRLRDPYEGVLTEITSAEYERHIPGHAKGLATVVADQRKWIFANSWHMNEFESAAMWDLYLNSSDGIAIETDFARFRESFSAEKEHDVLIGTVKYIDYAVEPVPFGNFLFFPLHKRKSFEHERELRAIVWLLSTVTKQKLEGKRVREKGAENTPLEGINVHVNVETLIRNVFVSPTAQRWYVDVVRSVLDRYNLAKIPVTQSDLYAVK
jgi:hypothetical protein